MTLVGCPDFIYGVSGLLCSVGGSLILRFWSSVVTDQKRSTRCEDLGTRRFLHAGGRALRDHETALLLSGTCPDQTSCILAVPDSRKATTLQLGMGVQVTQNAVLHHGGNRWSKQVVRQEPSAHSDWDLGVKDSATALYYTLCTCYCVS